MRFIEKHKSASYEWRDVFYSLNTKINFIHPHLHERREGQTLRRSVCGERRSSNVRGVPEYTKQLMFLASDGLEGRRPAKRYQRNRLWAETHECEETLKREKAFVWWICRSVPWRPTEWDLPLITLNQQQIFCRKRLLFHQQKEIIIIIISEPHKYNKPHHPKQLRL